MDRAGLRTLFGIIVSSTTLVAACGGASEGGGSSGGSSGGIVKDEFQALCVSYQDGLLPGVTPIAGIDYIEQRIESANGPPTKDAGAASTVQIQSRFGTACATATDKTKCLNTLGALRSTLGFVSSGQDGRSVTYFAITRGDSVETITSSEGITAALVPIDTAQEAGLLASLAGIGFFDCQKPVARKTATGFEIITQTGTGCGAKDDVNEHRLAVSTSGTVTEVESAFVKKGDPGCAIGRVPEGLVPIAKEDARVSGGEGDLGAHFARAQRLEAASVIAFERLADELARFGAPDALIAAARRSAEDERRHALATARIARRFGAELLTVDIEPARERTLLDIALENAAEGCVRESFGALVALYQARHASDEEIRREMAAIAEDETNHAAFSWELHAWACAHLAEEDAARVERARRDAMGAMRAELEAVAPIETRAVRAANAIAGWPARGLMREMFEAFERGLTAS